MLDFRAGCSPNVFLRRVSQEERFKMPNIGLNEAAAVKLAQLSREVEELESGRNSLLKRVDRLRASLQSAGQRTAAMRASIDLLCDHVTSASAALAELRALEEEIKELERGLVGSEMEASGLAFESEGLADTIEDAEDDLDRVSAIILEGRAQEKRGH